LFKTRRKVKSITIVSIAMCITSFHFINRVQMSCFGVKFFLFFGTLKRLREENSG
jgi:hypothetical protein